MFFNKGKITNTKPRQKRTFAFTDKECRNMTLPEGIGQEMYTDELCPNLTLVLSKNGNHSYTFRRHDGCKTIGAVWAVTVKEAREIANNIRENYPEFKKERKDIKMPMFAYFKIAGKYPHQPNGTEIIISDENASLKQKIKELQEEIARLNRVVAVYSARLDSIADYARSPLPTDNEEKCDWLD